MEICYMWIVNKHRLYRYRLKKTLRIMRRSRKKRRRGRRKTRVKYWIVVENLLKYWRRRRIQYLEIVMENLLSRLRK